MELSQTKTYSDCLTLVMVTSDIASSMCCFSRSVIRGWTSGESNAKNSHRKNQSTPKLPEVGEKQELNTNTGRLCKRKNDIANIHVRDNKTVIMYQTRRRQMASHRRIHTNPKLQRVEMILHSPHTVLEVRETKR